MSRSAGHVAIHRYVTRTPSYGSAENANEVAAGLLTVAAHFHRCISVAAALSSLRKEVRMDNAHSEIPPELVFPPQVPFSWTLRGARAARLGASKARRSIGYRIAGVADVDKVDA